MNRKYMTPEERVQSVGEAWRPAQRMANAFYADRISEPSGQHREQLLGDLYVQLTPC